MEQLEARDVPTVTFTVMNGASSGNGSLAQAVANANADTSGGPVLINFDPTYFATAQAIAPGSTLELSNTTSGESITIQGPAAGVTIQGGGASSNYSVITVDSGVTAFLNGLTISSGQADYGGGIDNNGTLTVTSCNVAGNTAFVSTGGGYGGGIYNAGTLTVDSSRVSSNTAYDTFFTYANTATGGGIFNAGVLTVSNTTIDHNQATGAYGGSSGGGIYNAGTMMVSFSTLSSNSANNDVADFYGGGNGGGILNAAGGMATLEESTVSGNSSSNYGGGVYNNGTLNVKNSTIAFNQATGNLRFATNHGIGGGIAMGNGGTLTVLSSTLTGNSARTIGGGIYNCPTGATVNLGNTIVAGNTCPTGTDINGTVVSQGNNLIGNTSGAAGFTGTDLKNVSANFDPAGLQSHGGLTQTIALLSGSPAIGAGSVALAQAAGLSTDQRGPGYLRFINGALDIGAIEVGTLGLLSSSQWTVGQPSYPGTIPIDGGTAPFTVSSQSNLPPGLTATISGSNIGFTGSPSMAGTYSNVQIAVTDTNNLTLSGTFSIIINQAPTFSPLSPVAWTAGVGYTGTITISGGTGTYSNLSTSGLPSGYSASLSGNIITVTSANPSAGAVAFTVTVQDGSGGSFTSGTETLTVHSPPSFTTLSPASWTAGVGYSGTVTVSGGTGTYSNLSTSGLPSGYSASLSGSTITISNANPAGGTITFTATVQDGSGGSFTSTLETLTVNPVLNFTALAPAAWTTGVGYTGTISISGGTGTYSNLSTSGLPSGYSASLS